MLKNSQKKVYLHIDKTKRKTIQLNTIQKDTATKSKEF